MTPSTTDESDDWRRWLLVEHRLAYERTLLALLWTGAAAITAGSVAAITSTFTDAIDPQLVFRIGSWTAAAGVSLAGAAVLATVPIRRLRRHKADERSGSRYERQKNWTRLKSGSVLLNLLVALAAIELALALLSTFTGTAIDPPTAFSIERITYLLLLVVGLDVAYTHRVGLLIERRTKALVGLSLAFAVLGLVGTAVFAGLGAFVAFEPTTLPLIGAVEPGHSPLFLLAGAGTSAVSLFIARELPTVKALFLGEREFREDSALSRRKSVVLPTTIAFALLFLVLLLVFVFEVSVVGRFAEVSQSVILVGVFGFMILALVVSIGVSVSLSHSEDETPLYQRVRSAEERTKITVLGVSLGLALVFLGLTIGVATGHGLLGFDVASHHWVDVLALGVLAGIGPYGFYRAHEAKRIREIEERFPDFMRDLAANRKAGLTLPKSVQVAAKGDYGALTPDVVKMAEQISWNVGFEEAFERFADRVDTPLVRRACSLIVEANRSGGHVIDVLEAAATDAREIKTLENERRMTMSLYTAVVYIAFLVFLAVAAVLYGQFIPEVLATTGEAAGGELAGAGQGGAIGGLGVSSLALADYRTFFFLASVTQGAGNGILAGMMQTGEPLNGLRHAFFMVLATIVLFVFLL